MQLFYPRATMNLWVVLVILFIPLDETHGACRTEEECRKDGNSQCNDCKAVENIYHVFNGAVNLTIHCDFGKSKMEYKVSLVKGISKNRSVCHGSFNASHQPFQHNNCLITPSKSNVTFYLSGLFSNDTDIYFLHKEHMAPPPYEEKFDDGFIVHVKENGPQPSLPPTIQNSEKSSWSLLAAVVALAVYSSIITIVFFYTLLKRRKTRILQSEYINVVPLRPKHHQPYAPTPRHAQVR